MKLKLPMSNREGLSKIYDFPLDNTAEEEAIVYFPA